MDIIQLCVKGNLFFIEDTLSEVDCSRLKNLLYEFSKTVQFGEPVYIGDFIKNAKEELKIPIRLVSVTKVIRDVKPKY